MRVMCKPGSVGDLGGQPPRSTRPKARRRQNRHHPLIHRMLNHTMGHCEICAVNGDMLHLLGTLGVSKGRIRAGRESPSSAACSPL